MGVIVQTVHGQQGAQLQKASKTSEISVGMELCEKLISNFEKANVPAIVALFDENATIRFPYAGSLGAPEVFKGTKAYGVQISRVYATIKDFKFFNVRITPGRDHEIFWIECEANGLFTSENNDRKAEVYEQKYVMKLHIIDDKIVDYTEYWNPVPIIEHMKITHIDEG